VYYFVWTSGFKHSLLIWSCRILTVQFQSTCLWSSFWIPNNTD